MEHTPLGEKCIPCIWNYPGPCQSLACQITHRGPSGYQLSSDLCTADAHQTAIPVFALVPCCPDSSYSFKQNEQCLIFP